MKYEISYEKRALKELEKLEPVISRKIVVKINEIVDNISSSDIKKVKGSDYYRLRVGDYRILFIFEDSLIKILKVGHRKNIYKK